MIVVSYLDFYDTFLQNETYNTKCDNKFIRKCEKSVLQNTPSFLLQNATDIITKCDSYFII